MEAKCTEQALGFDIWVERPDTDMVAMLVCDTGALGAEFNVDTVAVCTKLEELASVCDGRRVRVLGVVNTFGPRKSTRREFACKEVFQ